MLKPMLRVCKTVDLLSGNSYGFHDLKCVFRFDSLRVGFSLAGLEDGYVLLDSFHSRFLRSAIWLFSENDFLFLVVFEFFSEQLDFLCDLVCGRLDG